MTAILDRPIGQTTTQNPRLARLLALVVSARGSDLHLQSGSSPRVRVDGRLEKVAGESPLGAQELSDFARGILRPEAVDKLEQGEEVDVSYQDDEVGRFRVHVYRQAGGLAMTFRHVTSKVPSFVQLNLPPTVERLAQEQRGLVLVTGPTGSGKTTTLAAMIAHINRTRDCHVVTIEDPIEVVHRPDRAEISQREIGVDTKDFPSAMRAAMRQDPDVILVGEMRDLETVSAAIHAAETGHLVLSTLHTSDAVETVTRIVDFFPPHQHHQVRMSLASTLKGVIGQRLVPTSYTPGRVPAVEILIANGRVQQCVLDPDRHGDISEIIARGEYYGMTTFDQSLARLCAERVIDVPTALAHASNPHDLQLLLHNNGVEEPSRPEVAAW
ncbi:MAG TPA: PilT/PilU family type 4a pilus ATPase [Acidimicrobiales bacterium]|jgi:twitching motility protein PilT|nr:PilT/PilU family type 4a pilus ATPase [Acidimicrobiales bacterium]